MFDGRVSVDKNLEIGAHKLCYGCREPLNEDERNHNDYNEGMHCQYCISTVTEEKLKQLKERWNAQKNQKQLSS